jgi:ATP:ADP antiporter, AAA family
MRVYRFFNLHPDETDKALSLFWIQLFSGVGQAFLYIVATTLLLSKQSYAFLMIGFLISGALVLLTQLLYNYLEHSWHLKRTYKAVLAFSILMGIFAFLMLPYKAQPAYFLGLFVMYHLLYYLNSTGFWGIAAVSFNLRESKRIFNIIGSGDIPSKMLGYGLVAVTAQYLDITYFLIASAGGFGLAYLAFKSHQKRYAVDQALHEEEDTAPESHSSIWTQLRLMWSVVWMALLFSISFTLIDFTFLTRVKASYYSYEQLATFLALFFAVGRLAAWFIKLLLSSRIQQKLGMHRTLLLLPLLILVFSILTLAFRQHIDPMVQLYAFGMLVVLSETLKSAFYEPYYFALFQALGKGMRLKGHNLAKGIMIPLGQITAGLLLLVALYWMQTQLIAFAFWLLLPITLIWTFFLYQTNSRYFQTIRARLQKQSFLSLSSPILDKDEALKSWLLAKIESPNEEDVVISLSYLKEWFPEVYFEKAIFFLEKESRKIVLAFLLQDPEVTLTPKALNHLEEHIFKQSDLNLSVQIIQRISAVNPDKTETYLSWCDEQDDQKLLEACLIGSLQSGDLNAIIRSGQRLLNWLHNPDPFYNKAAIRVVGYAKQPILFKQLSPYTHDDYKHLHGDLLLSLRFTSEKSFLPFVLKKVKDPNHIDSAIFLLAQQPEWLPDIQNAYPHQINQLTWIKILQLSAHSSAIEYLELILASEENPNPALINALYRKKQTIKNTNKLKKWSYTLSQELKQLHEWINTGGTPRMRIALQEEGFSRIISLIEIAGILYPHHSVDAVINILLHHRKNQYATALEMIEKVIKKNRLPSFIKEAESILLEKHPKIQPSSIANQVLENRDITFHAWTIAVALYEHGSSGFESLLERYPSSIIEELINNHPTSYADH